MSTAINDLDDSDQTTAKEWGMSVPEYRAEMRQRELTRVARAEARRQQVRADNRRNRRPMKQVILNNKTVELSDEQYERLERSASDNGRSVEQEAQILIDRALLESDAAPASETGEDDSDNDSSRKLLKRKPESKLEPLTREQRMEWIGKIQNLTYSGKIDEAAAAERIVNAYDKLEAKQNEPTVEQQRTAFVDAAVSTAKGILGK